jgi:hypothetical protein
VKYTLVVLTLIAATAVGFAFFHKAPNDLGNPKMQQAAVEKFRKAWPNYKMGDTLDQCCASMDAVEFPLIDIARSQAHERGWRTPTYRPCYKIDIPGQWDKGHFQTGGVVTVTCRPWTDGGDGKPMLTTDRDKWAIWYMVDKDGTPNLWTVQVPNSF